MFITCVSGHLTPLRFSAFATVKFAIWTALKTEVLHLLAPAVEHSPFTESRKALGLGRQKNWTRPPRLDLKFLWITRSFSQANQTAAKTTWLESSHSLCSHHCSESQVALVSLVEQLEDLFSLLSLTVCYYTQRCVIVELIFLVLQTDILLGG